MSTTASPATLSSLVKPLFLGQLRSETLVPYPTMDAEDAELLAMVADNLAKFAADHIDSEAIDKAHAIPDEVLEGFAELGLFGVSIPEEYDGMGMTNTQYVKVCEQLATFDGAVPIMSGGHSTIGVKAIQLFGTDEQKAHYLPKLASGELKAAFALSEAGAGSDAQALRCTATRDGDDWVLNGNKLWITNGGFADVFTVFARTPEFEREDGRPSITCFFVERSAGIVSEKEEEKLGIRGSSTVPLLFEDVRVPNSAVVGEVGKGFKIAMHVLNAGRTGLAANCVGSSKVLIEEMAKYTNERQQFGVPIGRFEMVQQKLARCAQDVHALECMVYLTTGLVDRGHKDIALEAALCKIFGTETLWAVVNDAVQCAGGNGFTTDYPYERMLRDARVNMIFEGTNEILRLMVAKTGLGELGHALKSSETGDELDKLVRGVEAPDPLEVPAPLQRDALGLSMGVATLAQSAAKALAEHGADLGKRQLVLGALTDQVLALYAQMAVLSRAKLVVEQKGEDGAARELLLARGACRRMAARAKAAADSLRDPDVGLLLETAAAVSDSEKMPTEAP